MIRRFVEELRLKSE